MKGDTTNKYYDYYTCVTTDEKKSGIQYQKIAGVDAWYECNFDGGMPELNFENPAVREEMLKIPRVARYAIIIAMLLAVILLGSYGMGYDQSNFIYNKF